MDGADVVGDAVGRKRVGRGVGDAVAAIDGVGDGVREGAAVAVGVAVAVDRGGVRVDVGAAVPVGAISGLTVRGPQPVVQLATTIVRHASAKASPRRIGIRTSIPV
jgi:hypothetical protein